MLEEYDTLKVEVEYEIKPFNVPNYVLIVLPPGKRQDGFIESSSIPLRNLSEKVLNDLCDAFRRSIFNKAGKKDIFR